MILQLVFADSLDFRLDISYHFPLYRKEVGRRSLLVENSQLVEPVEPVTGD